MAVHSPANVPALIVPVVDGPVDVVGPRAQPPAGAAELDTRGRGPILTDRDQRRGDRTHGPRGKRTVTVHDLRGPRLVPVQVSAATVNAAGDPDTKTVNEPEALPPVLTSVSIRSGLAPIDTRPYAYWDRSNTSTAGPAPADAAPTGTPSSPVTAAADSTAHPMTPRTATLSPEPVPAGAHRPTRPYTGCGALFRQHRERCSQPEQPPSRKAGGAHSAQERSGQCGTLLTGLTAAVNGASLARPYPFRHSPLTMPLFRSGSLTLPRR